MITDFNLEKLYGRIQDARTREYFEEVLGDFYSGHYRSAVVMLYSVVMADLIFKLQQLEDIYEDEPARNILASIRQMQTENPKSPAWEEVICKELVQNRRIISTPELAHIEALRNDRHLCAHPVVSTYGELHRPNRSSVYAHMINSLSEILCRPAFLESELLIQILDDLASRRSFMRKRELIHQYLKSQYFDRLDNPDIEVSLFLKLWKFVFKLTNAEASKNRDVNLCMLSFLLVRNELMVLEKMKLDSKKYSNQIDLENPTILECFVKFCNSHDRVYETLDDAFKVSFSAKLDKLPLMRNIAFFLHDDLPAFFNKLLDKVAEDDDVNYMMKYTEKRLGREQALRIPISIFAGSECFADANTNYTNYIKPYFDEFTLSHYREILNGIKGNGQVREAHRVISAFPSIKSHILGLDPDFDFSPYSFIQ